MNKSLRRAVIAGNWKMNETRAEAKALLEEMVPSILNADCDIVFCVPYTNLETVADMTRVTRIKVGAENVHYASSGAFTGEISAEMLCELGVRYVIVGDSERRRFYGDTDETVNLRAKATINAGMTAIICVGEMLSEREHGVTNEVVAMQTKIALEGIKQESMKNVIIAYEPVWAIGTGRTPTVQQANDVCKLIRNTVANLYDQATADSLTILYGGSMNPKNCEELLSEPDIDGGLIGGSSLKADEFSAIVAVASRLGYGKDAPKAEVEGE